MKVTTSAQTIEDFLQACSESSKLLPEEARKALIKQARKRRRAIGNTLRDFNESDWSAFSGANDFGTKPPMISHMIGLESYCIISYPEIETDNLYLYVHGYGENHLVDYSLKLPNTAMDFMSVGMSITDANELLRTIAESYFANCMRDVATYDQLIKLGFESEKL